TSTIPIGVVSGPDPVEAGFVTSLNRPSGDVTGVGMTTTPLDQKRLELLHELAPKPAIIAALMDDTISRPEASVRAVEAAAGTLGRQILVVKARTESEIDTAFASIVQAGAGALFVGSGPSYVSKRRQLVALAARHALPASYQLREFVAVGGLMSYAANDTDGYRHGGRYGGRILICCCAGCKRPAVSAADRLCRPEWDNQHSTLTGPRFGGGYCDIVARGGSCPERQPRLGHRVGDVAAGTC